MINWVKMKKYSSAGLWYRLSISKSNSGLTMNLPHHLKRLMKDWFVTKDKVRNDVSENANEDIEGIQWVFSLLSEIRIKGFTNNRFYSSVTQINNIESKK